MSTDFVADVMDAETEAPAKGSIALGEEMDRGQYFAQRTQQAVEDAWAKYCQGGDIAAVYKAFKAWRSAALEHMAEMVAYRAVLRCYSLYIDGTDIVDDDDDVDESLF